MIEAQKLAVDYVRVDRNDKIEETGEYHLEGLFVRLDHAIRTVKIVAPAYDPGRFLEASSRWWTS